MVLPNKIARYINSKSASLQTHSKLPRILPPVTCRRSTAIDRRHRSKSNNLHGNTGTVNTGWWHNCDNKKAFTSRMLVSSEYQDRHEELDFRFRRDRNEVCEGCKFMKKFFTHAVRFAASHDSKLFATKNVVIACNAGSIFSEDPCLIHGNNDS